MAILANDPRIDCRCARISDRLVEDLRSIVLSGVGGLTGDSKETGGILIGKVVGAELCLEACEEVSCEHRAGPSYMLGPTDRIRLSEVLNARCGVEGFFRSVISQDPGSDEADAQFVQRYFPQGDCIYLTLRVLSERECVASARWFRHGQPLPLVEEGSFALEPGRTPVLRTRQVLPPPKRATRVEPNSRRPRRWKPIFACLLVGLAAGVGFELWSLQRANKGEAASPVISAEVAGTPWTDLHLDARPSGKQIDITWSADTVRSLHATGGKLTVSDGGTPREISLSESQILAGEYRYSGSHPDFLVRLVVSAGGQGVASGSVRLSSAVASAPPDAQTDASGSVAVPPSSVREVRPELPEGIRSRLSAQVVIPVEVKVSDRGRVVSAHVSDPSGDGLHRYLVEQAEKAARGWQFTPARTRSGTPVAANKTIEFVFAP